MPCNGLTYAPLHDCACYPEAKLFGFNALTPLAPTRPIPANVPEEGRLQKDPAQGMEVGADAGIVYDVVLKTYPALEPIAFRWPAVVLAQFSVACAFSVRTMRVTFDQLNPRAEEVARTLGCTRGQAFWQIALPQSRRGIVTAFTIAWARARSEFGPRLVMSRRIRRCS